MPETKYAKNPQTGQVIKNDGNGWTPVQTATNGQGEVLINEGNGWGALPSGNTRPEQPAPQGQLDQIDPLQGLHDFMGGNGGRAVAAGLGAANSASLGTLDRAVGYADWLIPGGVKPWNDTPERSVKRAQKTRQTLRELHPASSTTGEIAGFMAPGGAVYQGGMKLGAKLPQLSGKAAPYMARLAGLAGLGGAENAVFQSTVGASNQEAETGQRVGLPERGQMAVEGGTNPIALAAGPAASLAYRGGRGLMTGKVTPKFLQPTANAPTVSAIRDMKNEAYKASDAIDVTYTADGIQNLVAGIENKLQSLNVDPILHPRASRTLKRMQDRVGRDMSLQELENIRRFTRRDVIDSGAAGGIPGANDAEKMLGSVIMDEIDGFIGAGKDVAKGDGLAAADAITNARRLNTVYRKSQKLEDAVEKASNRAATTGSGGNFENALRQEIKKVYENPKLASGFNKAEKEAMKKVIDGGPTQNLLRNIGKLSPQGNGLMSMLGMFGLAGSYTNPLLAVPPVAGFVAKRMAEKGIKNKFDDLDALVRSGANQPPMAKDPQAGFVAPELLGSVGGAGAGGAYGNLNPTDFDGDGEISRAERMRSMGQGAAIGGIAGLGGGNLLSRPTPSSPPKTSARGELGRFNVVEREWASPRGFLGRKRHSDMSMSDYTFSSRDGKQISVTASADDAAPGKYSIDWSVDGNNSSIREKGLPVQSAGETKDILSGVEGAVRQIIKDKSPVEIRLSPRTPTHEKIYKRMLQQADLQGYKLTRERTPEGPAFFLRKGPDQAPGGARRPHTQ